MKNLSVSEKNYLETIYILDCRTGAVRAVDVAHYMEHSKPSVSNAVANLIKKGYLKKCDGELKLTEKGALVAEQIVDRHCVLEHALRKLGVDEEIASTEARQMERVVSEEMISVTAEKINCTKAKYGYCDRESKEQCKKPK